MVRVWDPGKAKVGGESFLARNHYWVLLAFLLVAGFITFGPRPDGLAVAGQRVLGIFALCAALWVTQLIPLQITSILAIVLLPVLNVMPSHEAFALFGNKAVFFILGAFILSAVLVDSGLSVRLTCLALDKLARSPRRLRDGIMFFAAFASFWMSEHAVAAMLFPIVTGIVRAFRLKPLESRFAMSFFFALAWGCVIGGIATYLGGARNPLAVGILFAETGLQISFLRWLTASFPIVILMLAVALVVLHRGYREEPVDLDAAHRVLREELRVLGPIGDREKGVALVTLLTLAAWILLHEIIGLATIALLSVAVMFIFRLTRWEVIESNVNWGIILMYGGAIALGSAVHSTGASQWLVDVSLGRFDLPGPAILILMGLLSLILTEFISNAAVVSVLMPVGIGFAQTHGLSYEAITLAIALPSGLTYILPMGTPATAIAYGSGYIPMREFLRAGPVMAFFSLIVFALVALSYWPALGY